MSSKEASAAETATAILPQEARHLMLMRQSFPADLAAIPPVRRRLRTLLCESGLEAIAYEAALATQELLANAVEHGCHGLPPDTEVTVTAEYSGAHLRVTVHDPSSERPHQRSESLDMESGRGLSIVGGIADRWGVEPHAHSPGKVVWLELDSPLL
ncbi:ATP-binding protein [Streptomyces sp. NPDC002917]|uniref:ATP-binding protein n=1 Tax=Streptomyces sp. NPDC002917 TaxID=3364671 RepID=UPI003680AA9D